MARILFQAIPAWVTKLNNANHSASIWCGASVPSGAYSTVELVFPNGLIKISDKTQAQYDDFLTEITSQSDEGDSGAVYYAVDYQLESTFNDCLNAGAWTLSGVDQPYQYRCWALMEGNSISRYHGFKVKVTEVDSNNSNNVKVEVYRVDDDTLTPQRTGLEINLDSADCLPSEYDPNTISGTLGSMGALYISDSIILNPSTILEIPKLPPGLASRTWPSRKR